MEIICSDSSERDNYARLERLFNEFISIMKFKRVAIHSTYTCGIVDTLFIYADTTRYKRVTDTGLEVIEQVNTNVNLQDSSQYDMKYNILNGTNIKFESKTGRTIAIYNIEHNTLYLSDIIHNSETFTDTEIQTIKRIFEVIAKWKKNCYDMLTNKYINELKKIPKFKVETVIVKKVPNKNYLKELKEQLTQIVKSLHLEKLAVIEQLKKEHELKLQRLHLKLISEMMKLQPLLNKYNCKINTLSDGFIIKFNKPILPTKVRYGGILYELPKKMQKSFSLNGLKIHITGCKITLAEAVDSNHPQCSSINSCSYESVCIGDMVGIDFSYDNLYKIIIALETMNIDNGYPDFKEENDEFLDTIESYRKTEGAVWTP